MNKIEEGLVYSEQEWQLLTRASGALQVLGGWALANMGNALLFAPEPTLLTKVLGVALIVRLHKLRGTGKWGMLDSLGNVVVVIKYDDCRQIPDPAESVINYK